MSFRGSVRRVASERVAPIDALAARLYTLGAPDDMIENLRWQWDNFDDEWTPGLQSDLVTWNDDRLFREITGILGEFHDATTETDDPKMVAQLAARFTARGTIAEVLQWVGQSPELRAPAALAAERAGKQRGRLIDPLTAMIGA